MTVLGLRLERGGLAEALAGPALRAQLEWELAARLPQERWFPAKGVEIDAVRIDRWAAVDERGEVAYAIARVRAGEELSLQLLLGVRDDGVVVEGPAHGAVAGPLASFLQRGGIRSGSGVRLQAESLVGAIELPIPGRAVGAEQSNSSVIFGDRAIAKLYRRAAVGPNPEVELLRYLSAAAPGSVPTVYATVSATVDEGRIDVLLLQEFLAGAEDGWSWMCARLAGTSPSRAEAEEAAAAIGSLTARLHAALAEAEGEGMAARPCTAGDVLLLRDETVREAEQTAAMLEEAGFDGGAAREASGILRNWSLVSGDFGRLMRVHGDYHLGQLLWKAGRFVAIDFEGEPARPLAERRALQHPLTDVAGMLRSFSYACATTSAVEAERGLRRRYLDQYLEDAARAPVPFLAGDPRVNGRLLGLFELRKALYEVRYELRNRPQWVGIPLAALPRALEALR